MPHKPPRSSDLSQARLHAILTTAALVRFARTLPEDSRERDIVRLAVSEVSNAMKRIYPPDTAEAAHQRALRTCEIAAPGSEPTRISGESVELYAGELAKSFMACSE
jgi:hypothetical protein